MGPGLYRFICALKLFISIDLNRLPVISPAKTGLFRISRELKFRVCTNGKPHASPHTEGEGDCFYKGKGDFGGLP